ncbi:MAG: threonine-phosphate decarboxylase [Methyloceanibacter sp.]|jgi:cobalamin biosynthesis protein CobC|nr:threonine-phosphate decarboxylase [Methyloceanibacter sp.]
MILPGELAPLNHGGDLGAARDLFPGAPEPFLDLSTGINPHPYPVPQLSADLFARLPEPASLAELTEIAAKAYGAPSAAHVVAGPGSQILMAQVASLLARGRAAVLAPTYAEHARVAELAGHNAVKVADVAQLADARLAIVVNPNNPDGRTIAKDALLVVADRLRRRGGLLVVDEAFMDVGADGASLADHVEHDNIVVLRSFGKFYGLAGLRLSFALASPPIATRLAAALGPWPVSGAALTIGRKALDDAAWREATRASLAEAALKLEVLLAQAGLEVIGGTTLFRLVRTAEAETLFQHLGQKGILVRRFAEQPTWLRFGLPGGEPEWQRLRSALKSRG